MRLFARRAVRRFHLSVHPKADGCQCFTLCLRRDVKHAADPARKVPGVWLNSYDGIDIERIEELMWHYVRTFETR